MKNRKETSKCVENIAGKILSRSGRGKLVADNNEKSPDCGCCFFIIAVIVIIALWHIIVPAAIFGVVVWAVVRMLGSSGKNTQKQMEDTASLTSIPVSREAGPTLLITGDDSVQNSLPPSDSTASLDCQDNGVNTQVVALAGVTFEGRQIPLSKMKSGDSILLIRRSDNAHDPNAIEVLNLQGESLGWLPRHSARVYAPVLDRGEQLYGRIETVVGGTNGFRYGGRVRVSLTPVERITKPRQQTVRKIRHNQNSPIRRYDDPYNNAPCPWEVEAALKEIELEEKAIEEEEDEYFNSYYDEDDYEDLTPEGLGIGDVTFDDCDSEY